MLENIKKFTLLLLPVLFLANSFGLNAQILPIMDQTIKWRTIQEVEALQKEQPRKVIIDMYTEWCGWCKKMDANTFSHPNIASYINQHYYAVKFDAETRDTIKFKGKTYINKQATLTGKDGKPLRRPNHDLAFELMNAKMSYPTIVYLDENMNKLSPVPGYRSPSDIEPFLMYFGENVYKNVAFEDFMEQFNKTFKDSVKADTNLVKWYSLEEAIRLNEKAPRKIFIDLHTDWAPLSKVMYYTTYTDPIIAKYLNENYYPVHFNAYSKDTVHLLGETMYNEGIAHPYHKFAVAALQGKMQFPALIFLDEANKLITAVPDFRSPKAIEPVLHFIKEDKHKTTRYDEYLQNFKSSFP